MADESNEGILNDFERQDGWTNRMHSLRCGTCMWFVYKVRQNGKVGEMGRCRFNAPTMKGFVPVFTTDWCGQHRLDENKI